MNTPSQQAQTWVTLVPSQAALAFQDIHQARRLPAWSRLTSGGMLAHLAAMAMQLGNIAVLLGNAEDDSQDASSADKMGPSFKKLKSQGSFQAMH